MKAFHLSLIILLGLSANVFAQKTDEEKASLQLAIDAAQKSNQSHIQYFSTDVKLFIDSLKREGIDTFGIYYTTQRNEILPLGVEKAGIIHWQNKGQLFHKDLNSDTVKTISSSALISYYQEYQNQIDTSYILEGLPVLTEQKLMYLYQTLRTVIIFCNINQHQKWIRFTNIDFHYDNLAFILRYNENSKIRHWSDRIEEQIYNSKKE